mmetsp:Transcript_39255/g.28986  ORF Transcript_39255/g.28986 Transcript_39255/m.28986 type:complete len:201 (+) Transcript_39255:993-1595(+)
MLLRDRCTNIEAEDITSAILDGVDMFILSHETSVGTFASQAVMQLAKSIAEAENVIDYEQLYNDLRSETQMSMKRATAFDYMATTACNVAIDNNVDLFICLTETGKTARFISKFKPMQPIISCSTSSFVVRQTNISRGVIGYKIPMFLKKQTNKLIGLVLKVCKEQGLCSSGNKVLIFESEEEGRQREALNFRLVTIDGE